MWWSEMLQLGGVTLAVTFAVIAYRNAKRRRAWEAQARCPECGYDLRASTERCPECGRSFLRDECGTPYHASPVADGDLLPAPAKLDPSAPVRLYAARNVLDAEFVRQNLESAGIPCSMEGGIGSRVWTGYASTVCLLVRGADVVRAGQLIRDLR